MPILPASPENIARAVALLQRGELVAFPTETVYGLGAHALDETAVAKIFAAKGRPAFNPLIVHVENTEAARELAAHWPATAEILAREFWPGPLTLVVSKIAAMPENVSAGLETVGLRVPAHPVALELLKAAKIPLAAPSANRSNQISPTLAEHVEQSLGTNAPLILDGGACEIGIESTVLDLSSEIPTILRPGAITSTQIEALIGPLGENSAVSDESPRKSPGQMERHYAPLATLLVCSREELRQILPQFSRPGLVAFENLENFQPFLEMPREPAFYAQKLYAALHQMDALRCDVILVEKVPQTSAWDGVRDRLKRASMQAE